jgi:hypothetical protein
MASVWEKSKYPGDHWLLEQYNSLYKPGGAKNPILVAGDPPLTQQLVESQTDFFTYLLAMKLDADEQKKFQALLVEDWKGWDRTAREAFIKKLAEWDSTVQKGGQFAARAKMLPGYLDRQGDDKTASSERWMVQSYQTVYKKLSDEVPFALMDKQPAPQPAINAKYGFPADPKHPHIFPKAQVFTQSHVFSKRWGLDSYVDRNNGEVHENLTYWWFLPTGRFFTRSIRCLGSERVKGTENQIIVSSYYLEGRQLHEDWGRYTIDDKDRIQMETDKGEKITMHLTYGRRQINWAGTVYDAPPMKKK